MCSSCNRLRGNVLLVLCLETAFFERLRRSVFLKDGKNTKTRVAEGDSR